MKIHFHIVTTLPGGQTVISEDHYLKIGQYNEFYLPALQPTSEVWIITTDENGVETKLHLKR